MFVRRRNSTPTSVLYHGTSATFDQLTPQPNTRMGKAGVEWKDTAIFATPDYRIALHYTANKISDNSILLGTDLRTPQAPGKPIEYVIFGGESLSDALDKLYGKRSAPDSCTGYIYHLEGSFFNREVGLGMREKITRKPNSVLKREIINRRELIDKYMEEKSITIIWKSVQSVMLSSPRPSGSVNAK